MTSLATSTTTWALHGLDHPIAAIRGALLNNRLGHAYLFIGPEGVGKATLARRLTQSLLCEHPADKRTDGIDPCLECRACLRVAADAAPDVEHIAIGGPCSEEGHRDHTADSSSRIRICQIRRLSKLASLAPFQAPRRIFVIDSANDLQTEAAHALLKTLEEPPGDTLIILLTTDPNQLLPTIRSRCQELTLRPLPKAALAEALANDLELEPTQAHELAALGRGRYGLAVRLHQDPSLRQLRETARDEIHHICSGSRNERFDSAARLARNWRRERQSILETLDVWLWCWHEALASSAGLLTTSTNSTDTKSSLAPINCTPQEATVALRATQRARQHLLENTNPQLALEVLMLDLPQLRSIDPELRREEALTVTTPPA